MADSDNAGHIDYPREGFTIFWDAHGLRIDVIDYNAKPLHLSWDTILDLAKRAGSVDSFTGEMGTLLRK
jgi:hypothetical protein